MKRFARIEGGVVTRVVSLDDGSEVEDVAPDLADPVACGDDVIPGWRHDGEGFSPPEPPSVDLAVVKAGLKSEIDAAAERERLRYITPGAGQAMTYQAKVEEARRFVASGGPPSDFPMLTAEIGITAIDLAGVAAVVLAAYQHWLTIGGAIEAARLAAKAAIEAAETPGDAQAVSVAWPGIPA